MECSDYSDSIKPTNASILKSAGTAALISSNDSSYFDNFETISGNTGEDTFYFAGDPGNNITLQGDAGNDSFDFNFAFTSNITAEGGSNDDKFTITNSQYTGTLELDGGSDNDTIAGSSNADHFGWNSANYSGSGIATNSAILNCEKDHLHLYPLQLSHILAISKQLQLSRGQILFILAVTLITI